MNAIPRLDIDFENATELPSAEIVQLFASVEPPQPEPLWKGMTKEEYRQYQYEQQMKIYRENLANMSPAQRDALNSEASVLTARTLPQQKSLAPSDQYIEQAIKQEKGGDIFCSSFAYCIR